MARPIKEGLDYFPLDVILEDEVELLEAECGLEGFAILIKLYQKIYQNSFYIKWNDDNTLLFARKINSELTKVNDVINVCFKRNLFDKTLHKKYGVLTSKGIQKRFFKIYNDARRKGLEVNAELILVNAELIGDNVNINDSLDVIDTEFSTQSKVKESKEDNNKEKNNLRQQILEYYDSLDDLPKYRKVTDKRKKHINARIEENSIGEVKKALALASKSKFLKSQIGGTWYSMDWLFNVNNFTKIIEGKFTEKEIEIEKEQKNDKYKDWSIDWDKLGI